MWLTQDMWGTLEPKKKNSDVIYYVTIPDKMSLSCDSI